MEIKYLIILTLFILLCLSLTKTNYKEYGKMNDFIKKYSLMVYLENNEVTDKRMKVVTKNWREYGVFPNLFPGLNAKNPKHVEIIKTLPIKRNNHHFDKRIGAYGLAGSFYKMLVKAYNSGQPYLLYLEDDALPILAPKQMEEEFFKALNSIPEEDGCYLLGATVLCKYKQKLTKRWERVKSIKTDNWGTTCLLFTRKSLKRILDYIHKHKINEPIDHTIKIVYGKSLYYWNDNISESGMFIGLFEQYETYCDKRVSVIDSI